MITLWGAAAVAQCLLLLGLWRFARRIILQLDPSSAPVPGTSAWPMHAPLAAMIIPAAGAHPAMPDALRSLLRQDYPRLRTVLVTATAEEPAAALGRQLQEEFPALELVVAGYAAAHKGQGCGQKNHNTLAALAYIERGSAPARTNACAPVCTDASTAPLPGAPPVALSKASPQSLPNSLPDIYLFADSTHLARPDFARQLLWPIVAGEAAFTTGYHNVLAADAKPVTLGYQVSVLLMRFLQAVAVFTQPWGGAMAMTRQVFERHGIAEFWRHNVVDDCSLAGMLIKRRLHVQLCPHAMLSTTIGDHKLPVWRGWMDRQVLFLKFCVPGQWWLLGLFAALMCLPTLGSVSLLLGGATHMVKAPWLVLVAAAHLAVLSSVVLGWRELVNGAPAPWRWLAGFGLGVGMFTFVYVQSIRATGLLWHGIWYRVGKGGRVEDMRRL